MMSRSSSEEEPAGGVGGRPQQQQLSAAAAAAAGHGHQCAAASGAIADWGDTIVGGASGRGADHVPAALLNALVMDYLLVAGYKDAAEKFAEESGAPLLTGRSLHALTRSDGDTATAADNAAGPHGRQEDEPHMEARMRIHKCIVDGEINAAISHINELAPELLDDQPLLYFQLRQQELIELIRAGSVESAIEFAQEHLSEIGESRPSCLRDLERTLSLLAFDNTCECPFGELLQQAHRANVANACDAALLGAAGFNRRSQLCALAQHVAWCQAQLDAKSVPYDKMVDMADALVEPTKAPPPAHGHGSKTVLAAMQAMRSQR